MSNINTNQRTGFFPQSKTAQESRSNKVQQAKFLKRNDVSRVKELDDITKGDSKVQINEAIKDFSRIKKAVDASPEIDNSAKIARLKAQIKDGSYKVDYEAIADKILASEY